MTEGDVPCRIVVDFDHWPFHAVTLWVPVTAFQTTLVPFATLTAWGFHLTPAVVLTPLITTAASEGWAASEPRRLAAKAIATRFRRTGSSLVVVRRITGGGEARFIRASPSEGHRNVTPQAPPDDAPGLRFMGGGRKHRAPFERDGRATTRVAQTLGGRRGRHRRPADGRPGCRVGHGPRTGATEADRPRTAARHRGSVRSAACDLAGSPTGDRRHRGRALLPPSRDRPDRSHQSVRIRREPPHPVSGRQHPDPATREGPLPGGQRRLTVAEAAGRRRRDPARVRPPDTPEPGALPQQRVFRGRRLRGPSRLGTLFRGQSLGPRPRAREPTCGDHP